MAAKGRTKRKPSSKANLEEAPSQPSVKPTRAALEMMLIRDECIAILGRIDDAAASTLALSASGPVDGDPVRHAADEVVTNLERVTRLMKTIDDQRSYVLATGHDKRGRVSTLGSCGACARDVACTPNDRLKAGYCSSCYQAWIRAARPDRTQFALERYSAVLA